MFRYNTNFFTKSGAFHSILALLHTYHPYVCSYKELLQLQPWSNMFPCAVY